MQTKDPLLRIFFCFIKENLFAIYTVNKKLFSLQIGWNHLKFLTNKEVNKIKLKTYIQWWEFAQRRNIKKSWWIF